MAHYAFNNAIDCKFYVLGLHDNYVVESGGNKFILRIYRNNWRSAEEVAFELELLAFLNARTKQVSTLIPTKRGGLAFHIDSPEGERLAALFGYADGDAPGKAIKAGEAELLGAAVANVHNITNTFTTCYKRPVLDIPYLLDDAVLSIKPFLNVEGCDYLEKLQGKLHDAVPYIGKSSENYGICIGDVNPTNFHINRNNDITLFDFDQCGYGYRAFEIGKFFSSINNTENAQLIQTAFIKGYQKVRRLSQEELYSIPYFEIISVIWVMAIHANNVDRLGYKVLEKPFWDRRLEILKESVVRWGKK